MCAFTSFANSAIVEVAISNNTYTPALVNISIGDQVKFVWVSGFHPTVSDQDKWPTFILGSNKSDTTITFNEAGQLTYHCSAHPGMDGQINVLTITGTLPPLEKKVSVYPNPATKEVNIDLVNTEVDDYSIMTLCGHEVLSGRLINNRNTINIELKPGEYFIILRRRGEIIENRKLLVQ